MSSITSRVSQNCMNTHVTSQPAAESILVHIGFEGTTTVFHCCWWVILVAEEQKVLSL